MRDTVTLTSPASASEVSTSASVCPGPNTPPICITRDERVLAEAGPLDHRCAAQLAARPEHARHLGDRGRRVREAVKARVGDHEVEAAVFERQRLDVGLGELDPVKATAVGLGAGPPQHHRREVGRDVVELLLRAEAAEGDAAAARDVQHAACPWAARRGGRCRGRRQRCRCPRSGAQARRPRARARPPSRRWSPR